MFSHRRIVSCRVTSIQPTIASSYSNTDGGYTIAKKGGEAVAYQGHKRIKTPKNVPITNRNGLVIASTGIIAGNRNDARELSDHLKSAFKSIKRLGIYIAGANFNADAAFDTRGARKVCFNHQMVPNIALNTWGRQRLKAGPKRWFNAKIYKQRLCSERTFAWIDTFRALLVPIDRRGVYSWAHTSSPLR